MQLAEKGKASKMGSAPLSEAIKSIREWSLHEGRVSTASSVKATDAFGSLVFNDKVQQQRLPKPAYRALRATITRGETLDIATADAVAAALKDWATEHGATHYTHWFQPLTGITAEKHDSFLSPVGRRHGDRGVPRQGTDSGRARRIELPVGRHALHVRGARLHRVGPHQPAVAAERR